MMYLGLKQYYADNVWKAGVVFVFFLIVSILVHAQGPILFEEDFENDLGGFDIDNSFGNGDGFWHLSASCEVLLSGHTPDGALRYGRENDCDNYKTGTDANQGVVKSPYIDLTHFSTGAIELRFKYFLETEGINNTWKPDQASVEISMDRGPYTVIAHNYSSFNPLVVLTCPTTSWTECIIDLSAYAGSSVQLRFGFNTNDGVENEEKGFFVDDIVVYGPPCEFVIAGDSNGDCVVNLVDFAAMAENWLLNCHLTPSDPGCVPE